MDSRIILDSWLFDFMILPIMILPKFFRAEEMRG